MFMICGNARVHQSINTAGGFHIRTSTVTVISHHNIGAQVLKASESLVPTCLCISSHRFLSPSRETSDTNRRIKYSSSDFCHYAKSSPNGKTIQILG